MGNYEFMIKIRKSHDSNHKFQDKITLSGSNQESKCFLVSNQKHIYSNHTSKIHKNKQRQLHRRNSSLT